MKTIDTQQPQGDVRFFVHTIGATPGDTIRNYISLRYDRLLDYSKYKCSLQNMDELAVDLLNEVLLNILQRDEQFLLKLHNQKKVQSGKNYTELDFFILRAIDLNSISDNAPFRWKNKPIQTNREVKLERLKIIDEEYSEIDRPAEILKQMRLVRWIFAGLDLTEFERQVFNFRFFEGNALSSEWPGPETAKHKYETYQRVEGIIHHILFRQGLTKVKPKKSITKQQSEIVERWFKTHKINIKQSEYSNN